MNKTKKSKAKKSIKKNIDKSKLDTDIVAILTIVIGIIILFSLFSTRMGIVGSVINGTTFSLLGFGAYFFPIFILITGTTLLLERFDKIQLRVIISLLVIFISFIIVLDGINIIDLNLVERIKRGLELSRANRGGGVLGSFFGFFFYRLFGSIGTYLILAFSIMASLLVIANLTIKEVLSKAKDITPNLIKRESKKVKSISEDNELDSMESNDKENNIIKITDYTSSSLKSTSTKLENKKSSKEPKSVEMEIKGKNEKNQKILYHTPPLNILESPKIRTDKNNKKDIINNAKIIEETMKNFGIEANVSHINVGPSITCYELSPAPGIKLSRIVSLQDNISLSLASPDIRIEAPIPGKAAIGIEVPNKIKDMVFFKEIITSKEYNDIESDIPLALGKDISGKVLVSSIDKMPHLLIAGATGSGKSVCINTIIMSLIYKTSPDDVKLLLIDPKVVELSVYNGIPHLLIPVVTDAKRSAFALNWAVGEMEKRYKLFAKNNVRDIQSYNEKVDKKEDENIPKIVIIIDELADLMMVAAQEIEDYISRLAQMARAAGMYLIVATQRPSVDVITGTIKANIPSRISFAVSSQIDSRTILDMAGAEKLLGQGDMLYYPSSYSKPVRLQGAFISNQEVEKVVSFLQEKNSTQYDDEIIEVVQNSKSVNIDEADELLPEAVSLVLNEGAASISLLQRKLRIGYTRAARIIDEMEARGIVGGFEGSKPRKVLITEDDINED